MMCQVYFHITYIVLTDLIITVTLHGRYYYYHYIIDKESEAKNG